MLSNVFVEKSFLTKQGVESSFSELTSIDEFWQYSDTVLLEGFFADENVNGDLSRFMTENIFMGGVRLRQLRVRNDSCNVHELFTHLFTECFDFYSSSSEDKDSFGLSVGSAWTYHSTEELDGFVTWGKFQFYSGGGFFQDLEDSFDKNRLLMRNLHENGWINRGTRVVFIEFTIYNPNINIFCSTKLTMEVLPTGGLVTSSSYRVLKLLNFTTFLDCVLIAFEVAFVAQILISSGLEMCQMKQLGRRYFFYFWNLVDLAIILIAYFAIAFSIFRIVHIDKKISTFVDNRKKFVNFDVISFWQVMFLDALGVCMFLIWIRMLKYVTFSRTMLQFGNTLSRCAKDVAGFGFMFLIVFVAYAQLGFMLFGSEISDFRSFFDSVFTLMRTILGDFDYLAIEKANRVLGPVYFLSYIFFVFFVLLNMFLAIINDTYSDVKSSYMQKPLPVGKFIKDKMKQIYKKAQKKSKVVAWRDDGIEIEAQQSDQEGFNEVFQPSEANQNFQVECLNCKLNKESLDR